MKKLAILAVGAVLYAIANDNYRNAKHIVVLADAVKKHNEILKVMAETASHETQEHLTDLGYNFQFEEIIKDM